MSQGKAGVVAVFRALADPTRVRIIEILAARPGITLQELKGSFKISRFAIMKHLNLLEEAGLLHRQSEGTSRLLFLDPEPLQRVYDDWLSQFRKGAKHLSGDRTRGDWRGS